MCNLPLAKALKQAFPDVKVDVLVRPYAAPIAHAAPDIDAVHPWTNDAADDPSNRGALLLEEGGHDTVLFAYPDRAVVRAAHAARILIRIGNRSTLAHGMAVDPPPLGQPPDLGWT